MDMERLRAIYPTLTDKELKEAADNLYAYFAIALKIVIKSRDGAVDNGSGPDTMKERSSSSLKIKSFEHG